MIRKLLFKLFVFSLVGILSAQHINKRAEPPQHADAIPLPIKMQGVKPTERDSYLCTAKRAPPISSYVVGFEPHADERKVHHMLVYGCGTVASDQLSPRHWDCKEMMCPNMTILYGWAKNAKRIFLPTDVGFHIGGDSGIKYVVLQVHYAEPLTNLNPDQSGLIMQLVNKRLPYIAGMHITATNIGSIPSHLPRYSLNANCPLGGTTAIHPFAFRVHTHQLGRVVSGYIQQNGSWNLLAKGNPQWPQTFYPIENKLTIYPSDILTVRCTYNSTSKNEITYIGPSTTNEMCNLYIMYYTDASNGTSFYKCHDLNVYNLPPLPPGNDEPLPPNTDLDELTKEHPPDLSHTINKHLIINKKGSSTVDTLDSNYKYIKVEGWGNKDLHLGQVTAVSITNQGNIVIFHRATHVWNQDTFSPDNKYKSISDGPISEPPILMLEPSTGKVIKSWGQNLFYLPHGLTCVNDHIWLTDVAMHQVFKFPINGSVHPLLTMGEKFEPGSDSKHFCKPTSVAEAKNGDIYVSDGYCNSRIIVFNEKGEFIRQWGQRNPPAVSSPPLGALSVPHKILLIPEKELACVADRENRRIQCFTLEGHPSFQIANDMFLGQVYSIAYTPEHDGLLYVVSGNYLFDSEFPTQGFVYNLTSKQLLNMITPQDKNNFFQPHDIAVTKDAEAVYIVEIGPNRIWKFIRVLHKSSKKVLNDIVAPSSLPVNSSLANSVLDDVNNFGTSLVILALVGIPVLLLLLITVSMKLKKRGHLKGWLRGYSTPRYKTTQDSFSLGNLLNPHKGFDRVALEESDESEVEEFSVSNKA